MVKIMPFFTTGAFCATLIANDKIKKGKIILFITILVSI